MLALAALIVALLILAFVWDLLGQPSPHRLLRRWRRRQER